MKLKFSIIFLCLAAGLQAGVRWNTHLAYNDMQQIAVSPEATYVLSGGNMFAVDKQTDTIRIYTLQDGFSPSRIVRLHYDEVSDAVMVWHQNGYLDYLSPDGIRTVSDLYLKEMTAGKSVNCIERVGDMLYMGMPYGVQTYDLRTETFRLSCYIADSAKETSVKHICLAGGSIYAATDSAVYSARLSNNIVDYRNWRQLPAPEGMLPHGLAKIGGAACALWGDKLYGWNGFGWSPMLTDLQFRSLYAESGRVYAAGASAALFDLTDLQQLSMYEASELILAVAYDPAMQDYWAANNTRGLMHITEQGTEYYSINSPAVNIPYRMHYAEEKLFVVNGGRWATQYMNAPYIMIYDGSSWTNILPDRLQSQTISRQYSDPVSVAADPLDDNHYWVACYGNGLFEMLGDSILNRYTAANSSLGSATGNVSGAAQYTRVDGLLMDEGTLWMACGSVGIRALKDGNWLTFSVPTTAGAPAPFHTPGQIYKDRFDPHRIWMSSCRVNPGIAVLDYGVSVNDPSDDRAIYHSEFTIEDVPTGSFGSVRATAMDYDGNVWLCTGDGLFYMPASEDLFRLNQRPKLKHLAAIGGFSDWLLKDQTVECIAIDSLNRKWVGTETLGVYVINPTNDSIVAHYTTTNSSLPSNAILSIAINPITQEVMIGTGDGLVSCIEVEDPVVPDDPENPDTALENVGRSQSAMCKYLRDGRLVIVRGNKLFDILGRLID